MGYYCTVPQCTSLAGKTKNVKFHRFPRDSTMADKWNVILKRGKPYTKYSKVCSLHFTQADYNVTTMGQWKTLSKDAVPSQNLPKLNPDGTVMVIRKTRTIKTKETPCIQAVKREDTCLSDKSTWNDTPSSGPSSDNSDAAVGYRLQNLNVLANSITPTQPTVHTKPKKDAYMQTDPVENEDTLHCNSASDSENYSPTVYEKNDYAENQNQNIPYEESKTEEYIQTQEKYILERNLQEQYAKNIEYDKIDLYKDDYQYQKEDNYQKDAFVDYQNTYIADPAEVLKNQQHNLEMLQQYHRITENQKFFNDNPIKQEIEMNGDDLAYDGQKELPYSQDQVEVFGGQRLVGGHRVPVPKTDYYEAQVKTEPDLPCESVMTSQGSPYYQNTTSDQASYYEQAALFSRQPGPELLIAKQNALSAQTQLWQNTMKRPFFYTESPHYNGAQFMHTRYEDLTRIMNQ